MILKKDFLLLLTTTNLLQYLLGKVGNNELRSLIDEGMPPNIFGYLIKSLL